MIPFCSYITISIVIGILILLYFSLKRDVSKEGGRTLFQSYLMLAESVIETTVIKLNETVVKELKKKGKLSTEEGEELSFEALKSITNMLGENILVILEDHMGDVESWILHEIEKYVSIHKEGSKPTDLYDKFKDNKLL